MESAASSIDDHVDKMPLHQPAIMLTFAYLRRPPTTHAWRSPFHRRRPPTTHAWRSPFHRPAVMLTFAYLRRPPSTPAWRSPFHRPAIMLTLYNFGEHGGICLIQTLLDLNLHTSVNTYNISWPLLATFPPSCTCVSLREFFLSLPSYLCCQDIPIPLLRTSTCCSRYTL